MSNSSFNKWNCIWLGFCVVLIALFFYLLPQARITSSVMELLPPQLVGNSSPELSKAFLERLDRQLVWLISPDHDDVKGDATKDWLTTLQHQDFLENLGGFVTTDQQEKWGQFYYQHRNALLDDLTRTRLKNGKQQADWIVSQLFSPFSGISSGELQSDPMLLVRGEQLALLQMNSQFILQHGWLTVVDNTGRQWYMIHAELPRSAKELTQLHAMAITLQQLYQKWQLKFPKAQMLTRGSLYYTEYASQQAQSDMSHLGSVTIIGVFLLIIGIFRSIRPLFLCLLSVGIGALGGIVATLLAYGKIHLMTLMMSMSIIGISVDYAIYYLVERMVYGNSHTPQQSLLKVRSSLLLALGTTVAAYLMMMLAPFPGIRQLALFASVGLTCACLTVVTLFPFLSMGLPVRTVPCVNLLMTWISLWRQNHFLRYLPMVIACLAMLGLSKLSINDDIASLQSLPVDLVKQDQKISELTGQRSDQTWFLITGSTHEQALQRMEAFLPSLQTARTHGFLTSYQSLPIYSQKRQTENAQLVREIAPLVLRHLQLQGVEIDKIDTNDMNVSITDWLSSPVSQGWKLMILTLPTGETGILLPVSGIKNRTALKQLADAKLGISWVDRKGQFDELFGFYRVVLSALLILALLLITVIYCVREGFKRACICILPSILSLLSALGVLGFSGMPLNLFSLLALVLVLGIGINYSIFFSNPRGTPVVSLLAVTVALCTTLLTLGMLVMSSTQAIQGFGLALCSGIFSAWFFSPLTMATSQARKKAKVR